MNYKFIKAKDFITSCNNKPRTLYYEWKEGDICLVHGKRESGLSLIAMGIANNVAQSDNEVLYVNADRHYGRFSSLTEASDNIYVYTPEYESPEDKRDYADLIFDNLEEAVKTTKFRTIVIDSVTHIAALSFGRNASAAYIMKRLAALAMRHKLSLLVVAEETTRAATRSLLSYSNVDIIVTPPEQSAPVSEPTLIDIKPQDGGIQKSGAVHGQSKPTNPSLRSYENVGGKTQNVGRKH